MLVASAIAFLLALEAPGQTPPAPTPPPLPRQAVHAPALPPVPSPVPKRAGEWPARPSGQKVTITEKTTVDDALEQIAKAAGWNLVANTGRLGDRVVILGLRNVPVEDAVDAVLEGLPLVATRHGDVVTVAPGLPGPPVERPVLSGFDKATGKRFSGKFADAPVDEALRKVAEAAGLSIVLPPGLRGAVTADFREAPVEDVLRVLLAQNGLTAEREGGIVTVSRALGPSVVIRGGKRTLEFHAPDVDVEVGQALREAERDARKEQRDAEREARQAARDAEREARAAERDARDAARGRRGHDGSDRVLSGDQVIGAGQQVGDVVVLRGNLRLAPGATAREAAVILGSVELAPGATVEDSLVAIGGDIHVSPGARVGKDAVSVGGKIVLDDGGEIEGQHTSVSIPGIATAVSAVGLAPFLGAVSPAVRLFNALALFATLFLLGLLLITVAPRRVDGVGAALQNAPVKSLVAGLLGTIALPVLGLLLAVTIVGIPLIAVQVLAVVLAWILGFTGLAMIVGRAFPLRVERRLPVVQLAIGTAALVLATRIPVLGVMIWTAAWLFTFGAVLRTRFGQPPSLETALPTSAVQPPRPPPPASPMPPPMPPA